VSLVARHLEVNGLPTVVLGSALDIIEYCGVPRFYYVDFPLGNPCGKPGDKAMQLEIVRQAMTLFDSATVSGVTVRSAYLWSDDQSWRDRYARVDASNREALLRKGERRRQQQALARAEGRTRIPMID
jgi:hypothetical protein